MDGRFHKEPAQDPPTRVTNVMHVGLQKGQGRSRSASGRPLHHEELAP